MSASPRHPPESQGAAPAFIVIEGVDGAGKGVQSRLLRQAIADLGLPVLLSREPGGSPGAEEVRRLIVEGAAGRWDSLTELLLIYAARRSHLRDTVWPALAAGTWVVCDRFADSSRAFQGIAGGLGLETVEQVHRLVVGDFAPALTVVLDLDPRLSLERARRRGGGEDRFESKGLAYHQRVRDGFRLLAERSPNSHVLIDASRSIEAVGQDLLTAVRERLGLPLVLPQAEAGWLS